MELQDERRLQVTFSGVLCGSRFKYFVAGALLPTLCRLRPGGQEAGGLCGAADGIDHLLKCTRLGGTVPGEVEKWSPSRLR